MRVTRGRRIALAAFGGLVALGLAGFFGILPGWYDRHVNRLIDAPPPPASGAAAALHQRLTIVDLHADPLLWNRDLLRRSAHGHIDLERLEDGNVALQVFSSVTKSPRGLNYDRNAGDTDNITLLSIAQLQPVRTWGSLLERSLYHAEKLHRFADGSGGRLVVIRTRADLDRLLAERAAGKPVVGALLSVEGLHDLEGRFENLKRLHDAGYRMASPTHFFDNEVAGSVHGERKGGLTPLGRRVIREMERLGMVVDVAHASHATIADVLAMAQKPVVFSHGGVKATCDTNRNLTDAEIRGIAATGGVVAIGYWDAAICDASLDGILRAILHVRDLAGIDHVALGSDWDGAVTTVLDSAGISALTAGLVRAGLSEEDIAKVMGGNAVRVLRQALPQGRGDPAP
ncbi:dipeptidase [Pedomonas sp. V897]|uniref:dipeptidase n=1 Tax=Pedomonas sp. V897 TaxID=3446482 RepID=UPI003EDF306E